jgi:hypothetical protein
LQLLSIQKFSDARHVKKTHRGELLVLVPGPFEVETEGHSEENFSLQLLLLVTANILGLLIASTLMM